MNRFNVKIALIGDGGVGKTSIRRRYLGQGFPSTYLETIGADFSWKLVTVDDYDINYQIWDLAGQERYNRIREIYYIGVQALLIVYSVIRLESLDNIKNWVKEVAKNGVEDIPIVLIGNKMDLLEEDTTGLDTGEESVTQIIAKELKMKHNPILKIKTSAKTGMNIEAVFDSLTKALIESIKRSEAERN